MPANFPAIGATMSSYSSHQYHADSADTKPRKAEKPRWKKVLKYSILTMSSGWFMQTQPVGWGRVHDDFGGWSGIWSLIFPAKLRGEDTGHVNILVAGNSADDPGHNGANLTDSIMLLSINTHYFAAALMFSLA